MALQMQLTKDECCNRVNVGQGQHRQSSGQRSVGGHSDDARVQRVQQRLADARAVYLELGDRRRLEAFDQGQIARREPLQGLVETELRAPPDIQPPGGDTNPFPAGRHRIRDGRA